MSIRLSLAIPFLATLLAAVAAAQPVFQASRPVTGPDSFYGFTVCDVDADGDLDVATACPTASDQLRIFANDGTGQFTMTQGVTRTDWLNDITHGDIDGDGDLDLVVIHARFFYSMVVYANDGTGTFTEIADIPLDGLVTDVQLADLDGDGALDAVMGIWDNPVIEVRMGDGSGGFEAPTNYAVDSRSFTVTIEDLDQNGSLDVAAATYGEYPKDGNVWVFWNDGTGSLPTSTALPASNGAWGVKAADLDGDGLTDLLATSRNDEILTFHRNLGGQSFAPKTIIDAGPSILEAALLDLESDGDLDLCVPAAFIDKVRFAVNDGNAQFALNLIVNGMSLQTGAEAADLDGDGAQDVVVMSLTEIVWYRNATHQFWMDRGQGLAGSHGVPALLGRGAVTPGSLLTVELEGALENSFAALFVGFADLSAPFRGGVLVPQPTLILPFGTGVDGSILLGGSLPADLPPGTEVYFQYWIADAAGPAGFAASNALRAASTP